MGPVVLEFCLSECWIGAGSGTSGGGKRECLETFGEVCDGTAGCGFYCFWQSRAENARYWAGKVAELFQDMKLLRCQGYLGVVGGRFSRWMR